MTPERWRRVEELFDAASELDTAPRSLWLTRECGEDTELRGEVERMLAADRVARASLEIAVDSAVEAAANPPLQTGLRIGAYQVLSQIGRGGMGVVYLARRDDGVFRKEVALKLMRGGLDAAHVLERFKQERHILARLEHPYIARVIDGGSTENGDPFLVLEYVKGRPVTGYCKERNLGLRERLGLFCKICDAVQYAHQNLVVHRDLKPGNIFVDENGDPKLLDFGIAKLLDADPGATRTLEMGRLLTPQYASPEQVNGEPVTAASDVYSLGAVLYELLTGRPAHQLSGLSGAAYYQEICAKEVTRASVAARAGDAPVPARELEGDLDNILCMALEKDPRRRYSTADHLAADIRAYLEFRPVRAAAGTAHYRVFKFVRRHRGMVAAAALVALSLVGGIATTSYQARRAELRLREGRRLASGFVFEVYESLSKLPGATKARELVVNGALDYLKKMEREAPGDPGLQFELATAYRKIADVQGGSTANLGDIRAALGNFETAERLLRKVLAARPGDGAAILELVRVLSQQGRTHHHMGDIKQALGDFRRASEEAAPLLQGKDTVEVRTELGSLLGVMAQAQRDSGDARTALETAQRGVDVLESALRDAPDRVPTRDQLSAALSSLAMSKARARDVNGAVDGARRSVDLLEAMRPARAQDPGFQRSLMEAYGALADLLGNPSLPSLGDRAGAEAAYRQAVALAEALVSADPNNRLAQADLAIGLTRLAAVLPEEKNAEAIVIYDRAFEAFRAVSTADPNNVNTRMNMAFALFVRGERKFYGGAMAEALKDYRAGREVCRAILARKPGELNTERVLIRGLSSEAKALSAAGQKSAALAVAREALAVADYRNPGRSKYFDGILHARAYDILVAVSPPPDACAWAKRSLDTWNAVRNDPGFNVTVERERNLAVQAAARCPSTARPGPRPADRDAGRAP